MPCLRPAAALCAVVLSLSAPVASALEVNFSEYGSAVALCQGALPSYEGALRKRPLAIQNEGATPAFLSCAFPVENRLWRLELAVSATTSASMTCTAVNGFDGAPDTRYATKTVAVAAGGVPQILTWLPGDFGASGTFPQMQVAVSCSLPPGASISRTWTDSSRYVGN